MDAVSRFEDYDHPWIMRLVIALAVLIAIPMLVWMVRELDRGYAWLRNAMLPNRPLYRPQGLEHWADFLFEGPTFVLLFLGMVVYAVLNALSASWLVILLLAAAVWGVCYVLRLRKEDVEIRHSLNQLMHNALGVAQQHGHQMRPWEIRDKNSADSVCDCCGRGVRVETDLVPRYIRTQMHGEAVERRCNRIR